MRSNPKTAVSPHRRGSVGRRGRRGAALILVCVLLLVPVSGALAATRVVSDSGTESTCSVDVPCSLTTGLSQTAAGDTLQLRAGTYVGRATFSGRVRASYAEATIIEGYPGDAKPVWKASSSDKRILFLGGSGDYTTFAIVRGIIFDGNDGVNDATAPSAMYSRCPIPRAFWLVEGGSNVRWEDNEFRYAAQNAMNSNTQPHEFINNWFHHIGQTTNPILLYLSGPNMVFRGNVVEDVTAGPGLWHSAEWAVHDAIIENNTLRRYASWWAPTFENGTSWGDGTCIEENRGVQGTRHPNGGGIQVYRGQKAIVRNNVLADGHTALSLGGGVRDCHVYNNTIYGNIGQSGYDYHASIVISDLTSPGNGAPPATPHTGTGCAIKNNLVFQPGVTSPPPIALHGANGHTFDTNPCSSSSSGCIPTTTISPTSAFMGAGGRDFQLASGNPAIDAGVDLALVPTDIRGLSRPMGSSTDIGAYEFGGVANPYTVSRNLARVAAGQPITASWTVTPGPAQARDWIALVRAGEGGERFIPVKGGGDPTWAYTHGTLTGHFTLIAPSLAGDFELLYCLNDGFTCPARSAPFGITTATGVTGLPGRQGALALD